MKMCFVKGRYLGLCSLLCENMFFPFFVVRFGCEEAFLGHWIRLSITPPLQAPKPENPHITFPPTGSRWFASDEDVVIVRNKICYTRKLLL